MVFDRMDLNLVRVFIAVYETSSVTLAADRLFVTQPSVSYALSKLRELFGDPLFVRGAEGMAPTVCAQSVYLKFREGLALIKDGCDVLRSFDYAESDRLFRVSMSDIGELAFLPPLMAALQATAPQVRLEVVNPPVDQIPALLASGQIDLAIGNLPSISDLTRSVRIFEEHYVCLLSPRHPLAGSALTLEAYLAARHAYVPAASSGHHVIEQALQERGLRRSIYLRIPHFTALPTLLANSDLIVTMPSRAARILARYEDLQMLPLPVDLPRLEVRMHWNEKRESNAALAWFLEVVRSALLHMGGAQEPS